MRELTTPDLDEELAEQLPARELMGSTGAMPAGHIPVVVWHDPAGHTYWQDVGPRYY